MGLKTQSFWLTARHATPGPQKQSSADKFWTKKGIRKGRQGQNEQVSLTSSFKAF